MDSELSGAMDPEILSGDIMGMGVMGMGGPMGHMGAMMGMDRGGHGARHKQKGGKGRGRNMM